MKGRPQPEGAVCNSARENEYHIEHPRAFSADEVFPTVSASVPATLPPNDQARDLTIQVTANVAPAGYV